MVMISCSNGKERGEAGHLETIFEAEGTAKNGNPSGGSRQGFQITENNLLLYFKGFFEEMQDGKRNCSNVQMKG